LGQQGSAKMSVQRQIERLTVHRAAEWLEVLRTGRSEEYAEFIRWIGESPRHMDEFLKLMALSREAREAMRSASFDKSALLARLSPQVTDFPATATPSEKRVTTSRRWLRRAGVIAATITTIAVASLWTVNHRSPWKSIEARVGEQRTIDLADGSVVILNALSKIQVRMGAARDIRLVEGEAMFTVARDAQRPFRVHTRDAIVQAVGTQFDVATRRDGTPVAVIEGKIRVSAKERHSVNTLPSVSRDTRGERASTPLVAGEAVHISLKGKIERQSASEATTASAWRQRRLIFENTPLEEAADEFNRYHRTMRLRTEGVPPGAHHYSGTFDADDLLSFTELLARENDLVVERKGNEIVIRPR
jgi:transmembrane sensor